MKGSTYGLERSVKPRTVDDVVRIGHVLLVGAAIAAGLGRVRLREIERPLTRLGRRRRRGSRRRPASSGSPTSTSVAADRRAAARWASRSSRTLAATRFGTNPNGSRQPAGMTTPAGLVGSGARMQKGSVTHCAPQTSATWSETSEGRRVAAAVRDPPSPRPGTSPAAGPVPRGPVGRCSRPPQGG